MKKKTLLFSITSLLTLGLLAASLNANDSFFNQARAECEHEGFHYAALEATTEDSGHKEFWTCCKCHETFAADPGVGVFAEGDEEDMTGGIPSGYEIAQYTLVSNMPFGAKANACDDINTVGGYLQSYSIAGSTSAYNTKAPFA